MESITPQKTSIERLQHLLPQLFTTDAVEGLPFLRAQITSEITVGIPLNCVEEVQLVSSDLITPMPNMPNAVLGLVQAKGHIFWLIDLGQLIGLGSGLSRAKRYEMVTVRTQDISSKIGMAGAFSSDQELFLGFAVQRVKGTLRIQVDELKTLRQDSHSIANACFAGHIVQNGELISILNF